MQIGWQEENVSTAAHFINPTGRTGNASVGLPLPWADEDVEISNDCDREPHPRIFLALARAVWLLSYTVPVNVSAHGNQNHMVA
jgi:hypothetical protein